MFLGASGDSVLVDYSVCISVVLRASVNLLTTFSPAYSADLLVLVLGESVYKLKSVVLAESFPNTPWNLFPSSLPFSLLKPGRTME